MRTRNKVAIATGGAVVAGATIMALKNRLKNTEKNEKRLKEKKKKI